MGPLEYDDEDECPECGALTTHGAEGCPEEWRCEFGDRCIVADPMHHRSECATAEMAAQYYETTEDVLRRALREIVMRPDYAAEIARATLEQVGDVP